MDVYFRQVENCHVPTPQKDVLRQNECSPGSSTILTVNLLLQKKTLKNVF